MRVTLRDVAEEAGVSVATASLALNNREVVNAATRRKVQGVAERLGYRANAFARALVRRESRVLGVIVSDITNTYFTDVIRGGEDAALEDGYQVIIADSRDDDPATEARMIRWLDETQVDGIAIASVSGDEENRKLLIEIERRGVPVVLLGRSFPGRDFDSILIENEVSSYEAVTHLIGHGYRDIAIINGNPDIPTATERFDGYRRALTENGIALRSDWIKAGNWRADEGYSLAKQLIHLPNPPRAIFIGNNQMALGVYKALRHESIVVPDQVALFTFDDTEWATAIESPLSVVAQPSYELGFEGVKRVVQRINNRKVESERNAAPNELGEHTPFYQTLRPTLIIRSSCGCSVESGSILRTDANEVGVDHVS